MKFSVSVHDHTSLGSHRLGSGMLAVISKSDHNQQDGMKSAG